VLSHDAVDRRGDRGGVGDIELDRERRRRDRRRGSGQRLAVEIG
jgi:hypothetical protein